MPVGPKVTVLLLRHHLSDSLALTDIELVGKSLGIDDHLDLFFVPLLNAAFKDLISEQLLVIV